MTLSSFLSRLCEEKPGRRLLREALDSFAADLDCERVFLFELRSGGGFRVLLGRGRHGEDLGASTSRLSHFAVRRMMVEGDVVYVPNAQRDRRYRPEEVLEGKRGPVSIIVVPVRAAGLPVSGIYGDHRFHPVKLDRADFEKARGWASAVGLVLRLRAVSRGGKRAAAMRARPTRSRTRIHPTLQDPGMPVSFHGFVSANPDIKDIFDALRELSRSELPVLIYGETGTGKSLLAQAVHASSARNQGPFVSLSLAALPETLIESELLGHARGAFTGAEADRSGLLVEASGGTMYLEEVADASPELQKKLLRVLESPEVRPLGAQAPVRVDVRIVASTSRNLEKLVRAGSFRKDLYYRLKGVTFEIPPLRERPEDILVLWEHFARTYAAREGREIPELSRSARGQLLAYEWPGNVRELENVVRAVVARGLGRVRPEDLSAILGRQVTEKGPSRSEAGTLAEILSKAERDVVEAALRAAGGNKARAAKELGISRKALYRRLEKYGCR